MTPASTGRDRLSLHVAAHLLPNHRVGNRASRARPRRRPSHRSLVETVRTPLHITRHRAYLENDQAQSAASKNVGTGFRPSGPAATDLGCSRVVRRTRFDRISGAAGQPTSAADDDSVGVAHAHTRGHPHGVQGESPTVSFNDLHCASRLFDLSSGFVFWKPDDRRGKSTRGCLAITRRTRSPRGSALTLHPPRLFDLAPSRRLPDRQ